MREDKKITLAHLEVLLCRYYGYDPNRITCNQMSVLRCRFNDLWYGFRKWCMRRNYEPVSRNTLLQIKKRGWMLKNHALLFCEYAGIAFE